MIFLAVAAPTPGRSSSSFCEALLRSTGLLDFEADALDSDLLALVSVFSAAALLSDLLAFSVFSADFSFGALVLLTVTSFRILSTVLLATPAFSRSLTEE